MRTWVFIFMLLNWPLASAETLNLEIEERKFGKSEILVEIVLPTNNLNKKLPLIITQHGSTLDAVIEGSKVRTDEHSKRLLEYATKEGFAVAVVDAFYTHDIKPDQKHRQPWAADYAKGLASLLSDDDRFDPNNFFFASTTGIAPKSYFCMTLATCSAESVSKTKSTLEINTVLIFELAFATNKSLRESLPSKTFLLFTT